MRPMVWVAVGVGYVVGTYLADVVMHPRQIAKFARQEADRRQKPLLNVGAGTPTSSLSNALFGPQLVGDVNMDISTENPHCRMDKVCYGDIMDIPFSDKEFGAVLASHVIEHVDDPTKAFAELGRVADVSFVIVPKWWAPHTWLHPGHQWYITEDFRAFSLWRGRL